MADYSNSAGEDAAEAYNRRLDIASAVVQNGDSLSDILWEQLQSCQADREERHALEIMLELIDENGFLKNRRFWKRILS